MPFVKIQIFCYIVGDGADVANFAEESLKMSRFKHLHVMELIGVCLDGGPAPLIIMPYMANGSLLKYLRCEREHFVITKEHDADEVITTATPQHYCACVYLHT